MNKELALIASDANIIDRPIYTLYEMVKTAEDFGRAVWALRDITRMRDLVLYGSVVRKEQFPHDLDILVLHDNSILDEFQIKYAQDRTTPDGKKFQDLAQMFATDQVDISPIVQVDSVRTLIGQGLLNANFMHTRFFTDSNYRNAWRAGNCWQDGDFDKNVLKEGKLWNYQSETYETPAISKYKVIN